MNQLQVFVSHFGLDLTRNPAVWPSALTVGDTVYNLKAGPTGTQYELANPIIRRDESGEIVSCQPRSRKEGKAIARSLIKKGKAKRVKMDEVPGQAIEGVKLGINLSFNPSLYRFATKIVANTAVFMGHMSLIRNSRIGHYLHGKGEWPTAIGVVTLQ